MDRPRGCSSILLSRGFPWDKGAAATPVGHSLGLGHVVPQRTSPIPALVHHAGRMSLPPTARALPPGWHPGVALKYYGQGAPGDGFPVFHFGASSCFPSISKGSDSSVTPGSSAVTWSVCPHRNGGHLWSCSDVILCHQAVEVGAGAVVARSQIRDVELGALPVPQLRILHPAGCRSPGNAVATEAGRRGASEDTPSEAWQEQGFRWRGKGLESPGASSGAHLSPLREKQQGGGPVPRSPSGSRSPALSR